MIELHADDYGDRSEIIRNRQPTWEDVAFAIRRMDGHRFTQVSLQDSEETGLMIAGGCGGYLRERMHLEDNYLLLDPSKEEEPTMQIERDTSLKWLGPNGYV